MLVVGVSVDLSFQSLQKIEIPSIHFSGLKISERAADGMFSQVNTALGGADHLDYLEDGEMHRIFAENMLMNSISVLAVSRGSSSEVQPPQSVDSADDSKGGYELPAIKMDNDPVISSDLLSGARVVFYCTHSAETYIPDSGQARMDGKSGLVNEVARSMARSLENKGVGAQYINKIHDWPDYNQSYSNSRETVQDILKKGDGLTALFDIHRDSIPGMKDAPTITVNGKKSACILIVVGTDERKQHPHWKENLEFAQKLYQEGQRIYPGLIKGVRTKAGTYNQEFFNHSLLLELGSDQNKFAEAEYAGQLFSDVLIRVLEQEVN